MDGLLADAVTRVDSARAELEAAEVALHTAVAAARTAGTSWRSIGRVTGLNHRDAAARWSAPGDDGVTL